MVNPQIQATSLKQLAEAAGKRPQGMTFGSAGVGSSVHMIGELFRVATGAPLTHVPYKGSSAAMADLLGGQIDMMFENPPTTLGYIRAGKLRAIAVTGKTRLPALPQVPTAVESGVPGLVATSWTTVAVGAKVPEAVADKLNADIRAVVATPEFRNGLAEQGMTPVANTRDAAAKFIAAEKARWDEVIKKAKLNAE
ncbi:tripartite-type tricarboxylate transporter receptor subunit TctC [Cupriavidus necator]|nr:tripartite-type tricarboxylate transporter receptor subunit TctC [Cupriavidus necator]